jgi:hypothetical protein
MTKIAISYRRDDSMDITGRIFDRLTHRYGRESVFLDIDSIPPGIDFRDHLQESLDNVDVLMVVVGPRWKGVDRNGATRIHSETDYVRTEVEIALKRNIAVVPLLVGGSEMPDPGELPESIRTFAYRNAVEIDSGRDFDHHMDGLIRAMDRLLHGQASRPSKPIEPHAASETETATQEPREAKPARPPGGLVPQVVGSVMVAQGLIHVGWFASSVIPAFASGTAVQAFQNVWTLADMAFGFGGLLVGIGTLLGKAWGRSGGITVCALIFFGNTLWFVEHFDKDMPRLIFVGSAFGLLLALVAAYVYVFRWPRSDAR